jgi:hypothetical protein
MYLMYRCERQPVPNLEGATYHTKSPLDDIITAPCCSTPGYRKGSTFATVRKMKPSATSELLLLPSISRRGGFAELVLYSRYGQMPVTLSLTTVKEFLEQLDI